jgi:hypothetical protein
MITRLVTTVCAVAVVGALAGCGGGTPSSHANASVSTTGAGNGASKTDLSCDAVPASMVNAALGTHVGDPSSQSVESTIVACTYTPTSGIGTVIIRIQTDRADADFASARAQSDAQGIKTTDLPGFEDKAYTSVLKAASIVTNTVVALKGTVEILVSSGASFDQEKALEQQIFAELI